MSSLRISVEFLPRWWERVFRGMCLTGCGRDGNVFDRVGELAPELFSAPCISHVRVGNAPYRVADYLRFGQAVRNSMRSISLQWHKVHHLLKCYVELNRLKFMFHRGEARGLALDENSSRADVKEFIAIVFQLWGEICGVECRHREQITLAPARFSTCHQQGNCSSEERRDCCRPGGRSRIGDELAKCWRKYCREPQYDGDRTEHQYPAAPVEPASNRFVHKRIVLRRRIAASYAMGRRLSA